MFGCFNKSKKSVPDFFSTDPSNPYLQKVKHKAEETGKNVDGYIDADGTLTLEVGSAPEGHHYPRAVLFNQFRQMRISSPVQPSFNLEDEAFLKSLATKLKLKGVGYYGPNSDPKKSTHKDGYDRFDTIADARAAYRRWWGTDQGEDIIINLCYYGENWGHLTITEWPEYIGYAWAFVDHLVQKEHHEVSVSFEDKEWVVSVSVKNIPDPRGWKNINWRIHDPSIAKAICKAFLEIPDEHLKHIDKFKED